MSDTTSKPPSHRDNALAVLMRLRDAGHVAYFAGGCVRDLLLGLVPKDFDVATDAPPDAVRKLFPNTQAVGAAFGVILVRRHGSQIEVATFRTDGDYSDGRRPDSVRFTTAEEDAQRRDFTINGLFLDPVEDRIIDYVGGQADLQAKLIRAIGDPAKRFEEDYLRMLRAVRFAARLGFTIEPATADAIRRHAPAIKRISPERIADELRRMLTPPSRDSAWEMLDQFGLLRQIFRTLGDSDGGKLFSRVSKIFRTANPFPFSLALAAGTLGYQSAAGDPLPWLQRGEVTKTIAAMRTLLKISNEESDAMETILLDAGAALKGWTLAERMRFMARPTSDCTRVLLLAISAFRFHWERAIELESQLLELEKKAVDCDPVPFLDGGALIAEGFRPGPRFKQVLHDVYDAQLEGRIKDRDSAIELAKKLFQKQ